MVGTGGGAKGRRSGGYFPEGILFIFAIFSVPIFSQATGDIFFAILTCSEEEEEKVICLKTHLLLSREECGGATGRLDISYQVKSIHSSQAR